MLQAARFGDEIAHTEQRSGLIQGMLIGAVIVGAIALTVITAGIAAPGAAVVVGAVLTGAAVGGAVGRYKGGADLVAKGAINKAAATVSINGIKAARSCIDTALCQDQRHRHRYFQRFGSRRFQRFPTTHRTGRRFKEYR